MEHNRTLMHWFKAHVLNYSKTFETLMWLTNGLMFDDLRCTCYKINDWTFYM